MEENNNMEWLEGQTITIPVEVFIKMRIEMAEQKQKEDKLYHRAWDAEASLREAKAQIKELLGIEEEEDA